MSAPVLGLHNVSAREIGVVMAVITAKVEPNARFIGFTDGEHGRGMAWGAPAIVARGSNNTTEFKVSPDERLRDVFVRFNAKVTPRGTDLAEPFAWAKKAGYQPDAVVIYTDGETWAGKTHVIEALADARIHRPVKLIVASTAASGTSIADPKDPDALNIAGFDANAPQAIAAFIRGEI
jgi:60 kDa SS-A/Ro ribonucleoprotein